MIGIWNFTKMIDFHNHVLFDVDDGPKTLEESIDMVRFAYNQGVTDIVQTVHFQHPKMEGKNTDYKYLVDRVRDFQSKIDKEKIKVKIHLSSEVFFLPNLLEISKNPLTKIGNGKFMLIEFRSDLFPTGYEDEFYQLKLNGITPIIAHPERYRFVQLDKNVLKKWKNAGYIILLDAGSILGKFGNYTKNLALEILDMSCVHLIGSDAHNNKHRNFCLKDAYEKIEKLYGLETVNKLKKNAYSLLNDNKIKNIKFEKLKRASFIRSILSKLK